MRTLMHWEDGTRPPFSGTPAAYDVFTQREHAARRAAGAVAKKARWDRAFWQLRRLRRPILNGQEYSRTIAG